jgi:hypothetical protein
MAEFEVLALGRLLGTTDGKIIMQGVEMVSPPLYREDIELFVEPLQIAARAQQAGTRKVAAGFAVLGVGFGLVVFYGAMGSD